MCVCVCVCVCMCECMLAQNLHHAFRHWTRQRSGKWSLLNSLNDQCEIQTSCQRVLLGMSLLYSRTNQRQNISPPNHTTIVALKMLQCVTCLLLRPISLNSREICVLENATVHSFVFLSHMSLLAVKLLSVAMEAWQWVLLALLLSYKIFCTAVNNMNLLKSACKVPDIFVWF